MNIFDIMASLFGSPQARLEQEAARQSLEHLKGIKAKNSYYDATGSGRRGMQATRDSSPGTIARAELVKSRRIARHLYRNNSIHKAAVDAVAYNTVVNGIRPKLESGRKQKRRLRNVQELMDAWASSVNLDVDGRHNLYGIQWQVMLEMVKSGECLVVRKRTLEPASGVNLQVKVLSGDYLDHLKDGAHEGRRVVQGIEYDDDDTVIAYWLHQQHPAETGSWFSIKRQQSVRVLAENVIHLFDPREPGQNRGLPWGMASFNRLRNLDDFQDARLELMKIASCMIGAVKNNSQIGGIKNGESADPLPERVEPGLILRLAQNEEMQFNNPPSVSGQSEFVREELQIIATDFGVWYPEITGDMSGINFSSGRLGWTSQHKRCTNHRQRIIIPHLCDTLFRWFREERELAGVSMTGLRCKWIEPPREMFDPTREVPPLIKLVRAGLKSMQDALTEAGENPEQHAEQLKQWNDLIDTLGIILDTDPRKVSAAGNIIPPTESPPDNKSDDNKPSESDANNDDE